MSGQIERVEFDLQKSYFVSVLPYLDTDKINVTQFELLVRSIDTELHMLKADVYFEGQRKALLMMRNQLVNSNSQIANIEKILHTMNCYLAEVIYK